MRGKNNGISCGGLATRKAGRAWRAVWGVGRGGSAGGRVDVAARGPIAVAAALRTSAAALRAGRAVLHAGAEAALGVALVPTRAAVLEAALDAAPVAVLLLTVPAHALLLREAALLRAPHMFQPAASSTGAVRSSAKVKVGARVIGGLTLSHGCCGSGASCP